MRNHTHLGVLSGPFVYEQAQQQVLCLRHVHHRQQPVGQVRLQSEARERRRSAPPQRRQRLQQMYRIAAKVLRNTGGQAKRCEPTGSVQHPRWVLHKRAPYSVQRASVWADSQNSVLSVNRWYTCSLRRIAAGSAMSASTMKPESVSRHPTSETRNGKLSPS
jgi:hypothetical protein